MRPPALESPESMDEARRLDLIVEAVRYCQRVRDMGMPVSSYSKALRERSIFFGSEETERARSVARNSGPGPQC